LLSLLDVAPNDFFGSDTAIDAAALPGKRKRDVLSAVTVGLLPHLGKSRQRLVGLFVAWVTGTVSSEGSRI
jgi:hypothetical protein